MQSLFEDTLDMGEASALALAFEMRGCTVILDDLKARKAAVKMNLKVTGTIGVILNAKKKNKIASVRSVFDKIQMTDFRISERIINEALKEAGE